MLVRWRVPGWWIGWRHGRAHRGRSASVTPVARLTKVWLLTISLIYLAVNGE